MARKKQGSNRIDGDLVQGVVSQIEHLLDDMESERGAYMAKCKVIREDIADLYVDAADKGVNKRSLKALIRTRILERKAKATKAKLDIDELSIFEELVEALGDFAGMPLGQAAVEAARPGSASYTEQM